MTTAKKKLRVFTLIFALWVAAMGLLLYNLGTEKAWNVLTSMNAYYVAAAACAICFSKLIYIVNLKWLLHFLGGKASFFTMCRATLIGMFVDNVLPTILPVGETTMGYMLYKKGVPLPKAMAAVVAQGISWFVGFIFLFVGVFAWILATGKVSGDLLLIALLPFLLFCSFLVLFVYLTLNVSRCKKVLKEILNRLTFLFSAITKKRTTKQEINAFVYKTVEEFHGAIYPFLSRKKILSVSFLLLSFHHFFVALSFFFVLQAFGMNIPLDIAFFTFLAISLVSLVSFLPGGLGVYEATSISLLTVQSGLLIATLATSMFRILEYWITIFSGGILALHAGLEEVWES